jgi:hypothetical protein
MLCATQQILSDTLVRLKFDGGCCSQRIGYGFEIRLGFPHAEYAGRKLVG